MKIKSVKVVSFSTSGNSKKVAEAIAKAIQAPIEHVNLTSPTAKTQKFDEFQDELAIITSPVYIGRIPYEAAIRIRRLKANNTPAVLVVTYGTRAYEDALIELSDIASEVGFKPIAAGAFIGEHLWSTPDGQWGKGRPDVDDLAKAEAFGKQVHDKFEGVDNLEDLTPVKVPGVNPYTLSMGMWGPGRLPSPFTDEELY